MRARNDRRCRGGSEDHVTSDGDEDRNPDGSEAAKIRVGDVGAKERHHVDPELVEGGQPGGGLLSQTERTGLRVGGIWVESFAGRRAWVWLLDEVDENLGVSVGF